MPKFLIRLHNDNKPLDHPMSRSMYYSLLYGPYENEQLARAAMQSLVPHDKEARFLLVEGTIVKPLDSPLEKPEDLKRAPDEKNWVRQEDPEGGWFCKECLAPILAVRVAHPIHSRSMPGAGSGQCHYEDVGYCPNCERKPSFHGIPIIGEP
jgi:hypothetical protein